MFSNRVYDTLKWVSLVFLPALITFLGVVFNCLNVENAEVILTIAIAFNTFLGSILGLSNINYNAELNTETKDGIGDDEDEE